MSAFGSPSCKPDIVVVCRDVYCHHLFYWLGWCHSLEVFHYTLSSCMWKCSSSVICKPIFHRPLQSCKTKLMCYHLKVDIVNVWGIEVLKRSHWTKAHVSDSTESKRTTPIAQKSTLSQHTLVQWLPALPMALSLWRVCRYRFSFSHCFYCDKYSTLR